MSKSLESDFLSKKLLSTTPRLIMLKKSFILGIIIGWLYRIGLFLDFSSDLKKTCILDVSLSGNWPKEVIYLRYHQGLTLLKHLGFSAHGIEQLELLTYLEKKENLFKEKNHNMQLAAKFHFLKSWLTPKKY